MPSVAATLKMFDQMTRPLQQVTQALNLTINAMDKMSNSANRDIKITNSLNAARGAIQRANAGLQELSNSQEKAARSQNNLNKSLSNSINVIGSLSNKVKGLAIAYASVETLKKGMEIADNYINQNARLSLINDNLQTQAQLQEKIYQAAQRSKASYGDTVSSVAKLGLLAKDAFSNNDEVIAFSELMNKAFRVSGSSTSEAVNGMYQLTQAMAAGKLQGDEFRTIMESAPMLAQAISKYTKVGMGELKNLSSEGAITSDIIKKALFSAADDINNKFSTMPNTFESIWLRIKNAALMQFSGIIKKVNELINTPEVEVFINSIINIIGILAFLVGGVIDIMIGIGNIISWISEVIVNNWSIIGPIFYAIVGVLLVLMFQQLLALIPVIWGIVSALAAKAGWLATNAGLWALNNFWIVMIGLAIAILISIFIQCGVTFGEVCGYIGGILGALFAFIYNNVVNLWNLFATFAEFIANLFIDPVYAIKKLFYDMAVNILGWISNLAKALSDLVNMIPGVETSLNSGIDNLISSIKAPTSDKAVVKIARMNQMDYKAAATSGFNKGASIGNSIGSAVGKIGSLGKASNGSSAMSIPSIGNIPSATSGLGDKSKGAGKGTGADKALKGANDKLKSIDDKIDISNEHLEMMRDLAEQESIQNFVSLTPTVQVTTGDIRQEADINTIISKIETYMENELVNSAEGVYA